MVWAPELWDYRNIFIKNLDPSITVKEINDLFASFGEIFCCKVAINEYGNSRGFALVNFNLESDAEKAIQAINGKMIREKIVYVAKFIPRIKSNSHNKDLLKCYNKNFGNDLVVDQDLRELFELYDEIVSEKDVIIQGNPEGFGLDDNEEHEDKLEPDDTLNDKAIEKTHQNRLKEHKFGVNLYIKNLGNDINDERLKNEFSVFGNITSAKVMLNKENNTSKGFGFVCFSAPDEATRAMSEMNGKIVEGKALYVVLAQKKEDRVAHLRSEFLQCVHQPQPPGFMMNPNQQRPFMARPGNILQNKWPRNMSYIQPRNIGIPANQNIMMAGIPQNQQRRNIIVDPIISQNRNARPITGNVQLNQPRPQYTIVANGRAYPYPIQDTQVGIPQNQRKINGYVRKYNAVTNDRQGNNPIEMPDLIESQIDLSSTSKITNADSMEAKQILGEKIYPLVSKHAGDMAGRITGMFLELDNAELLYMIENENSLRMKIDEALLVLNAHKSGDGAIRPD